jgi:hypothetical protein
MCVAMMLARTRTMYAPIARGGTMAEGMFIKMLVWCVF